MKIFFKLFGFLLSCFIVSVQANFLENYSVSVNKSRALNAIWHLQNEDLRGLLFKTPIQRREAFEKVQQKAAEEGNDHAKYILGEMFFNGIGVARDLVKAKNLWFVASNYAPAQLALAQANLRTKLYVGVGLYALYLHGGEEVEQVKELASQHWKEAEKAEGKKGNQALYLHGTENLEQVKELASQWWKKNKSNYHKQLRVESSFKDYPFSPDRERAIKRLKRATDQGYLPALVELGEAYRFFEADTARELWKKAIDQGYLPAQYSLQARDNARTEKILIEKSKKGIKNQCRTLFNKN